MVGARPAGQDAAAQLADQTLCSVFWNVEPTPEMLLPEHLVLYGGLNDASADGAPMATAIAAQPSAAAPSRLERVITGEFLLAPGVRGGRARCEWTQAT